MPGASSDECWLRYDRLPDAILRQYRQQCHHIYVAERSPQHGAVREELRRGLGGLFGEPPHFWQHPPRSVDRFVAIGHPDHMEVVADCVDRVDITRLDDDGYHLTTATWQGAEVLVVTAPTDRGLIYGTFRLLELLQTRQSLDSIQIIDEPRVEDRLINQWDEPFRGSVERGYGGESIFRWDELPNLRERYTDYARLLASVGINGIVLNDVNTTRPGRPGDLDHICAIEGAHLIADAQIPKVAALASVFSRYGIRPYLSINFAAPMLVGDLETADPCDPDVEAWWEERFDSVVEQIPAFGGVLVKADSEGEPGPFDYDRSHAEGANMLARALAPHDGTVFWRAFVYHDHADRAVQAGETFEPLDGRFADNVTLQIKNGPIDFQPREPVSSLFSLMTDTTLACELQVTQEYTGQSTHICYHGPMWEEVFAFDTYADGPTSPLSGRLAGMDGGGIVGVSNIGEDRSWFGNYLAGANLYAFGRMAWNPEADPSAIAQRWARRTFPNARPDGISSIVDILMASWPAVVDYETGGLGLLHLMYNGSARLENHYDPAPEEWPEYHGVTSEGIGVDRTAYANQYPEPIAARYRDPQCCPEEFLLFFHHRPYDATLADGETVRERLDENCQRGLERVQWMRHEWEDLAGEMDEHRYRHTADRLAEQVTQANRWRDTLRSYWGEFADGSSVD